MYKYFCIWKIIGIYCLDKLYIVIIKSCLKILGKYVGYVCDFYFFKYK